MCRDGSWCVLERLKTTNNAPKELNAMLGRNEVLHIKSKIQVIHALVQIAFESKEERFGRRKRRKEELMQALKKESSTRPPRGDQVDGLPRVVSTESRKIGSES